MVQAVDPVVLGKVRAKQFYSNDKDMAKNLGILMHGDGSFSGQGVVYETLDMQSLPEFSTGGTIHLVVNNQVTPCMTYPKARILDLQFCKTPCTGCPAKQIALLLGHSKLSELVGLWLDL